jgi:hypothetical protein
MLNVESRSKKTVGKDSRVVIEEEFKGSCCLDNEYLLEFLCCCGWYSGFSGTYGR